MLSARGDAQVLGRMRCHARERRAHAPSINELGGVKLIADRDLVGIARVGGVDGRNDVGQPLAVLAHASHGCRRSLPGRAPYHSAGRARRHFFAGHGMRRSPSSADGRGGASTADQIAR
jgi:hypothetical protein